MTGVLAGRFRRWLQDEAALIEQREGRRWEETSASQSLQALWDTAARIDGAGGGT